MRFVDLLEWPGCMGAVRKDAMAKGDGKNTWKIEVAVCIDEK